MPRRKSAKLKNQLIVSGILLDLEWMSLSPETAQEISANGIGSSALASLLETADCASGFVDFSAVEFDDEEIPVWDVRRREEAVEMPIGEPGKWLLCRIEWQRGAVCEQLCEPFEPNKLSFEVTAVTPANGGDEIHWMLPLYNRETLSLWWSDGHAVEYLLTDQNGNACELRILDDEPDAQAA